MSDPFEPGRKYTVEEYFRLEAISDVRHEFWEGVVFPVGSPPQPIPIPDAANVFATLSQRVLSIVRRPGVMIDVVSGPDERGATLFAKRTPDGDVPDPSCGTDDPACVLMLTSKFTFTETRRQHFFGYLRTESVAEVAWIFADAPRAEIYRRHHDGAWLIDFIDSVNSDVSLRSISVQFRLADLYAGIALQGEPASDG